MGPLRQGGEDEETEQRGRIEARSHARMGKSSSGQDSKAHPFNEKPLPVRH